MKAIVYDAPGDESVLRPGEVEPPPLGPGEVRIRVQSTSVNRADLLQRQGLYPPPPGASPILGLECSGLVSEVAADAAGFQAGDRVMALLPGGGYAEEAAVPAGCVMPVPGALSPAEAGAFPEVFLTAFLNIFLLGAVPENGRVLVHGGGGGVGTAAVSLCREAGLTVMVTAGSDEKCRRAREHGAHLAINYRTEDFPARVAAETENRGADVVLDHVGGLYLEKNLACLASGGRLVVIGGMGGVASGTLDLRHLLKKRAHVIGSTLRNRPVGEKTSLISAFLARFGAAFTAGRLRPVIDRTYPLDEATEAHRRVGENRHFGKVALLVDQ